MRAKHIDFNAVWLMLEAKHSKVIAATEASVGRLGLAEESDYARGIPGTERIVTVH